MKRGLEYEQQRSANEYTGPEYFSQNQLFCYAYQINHIYQLKPKTVLEVGVGNGFVAKYLKMGGINVYTADINEQLQPDLCAPLSVLPSLMEGLEKKPDVVSCCEVLEHMPLEMLEESIKSLAQCGENLYMTLPNYNLPVGFGGLLRLPPAVNKEIGIWMRIKVKREINAHHFWEIGMNKNCAKNNIERLLRKYYNKISTGDYMLEPYHTYFKCLNSKLA